MKQIEDASNPQRTNSVMVSHMELLFEPIEQFVISNIKLSLHDS